MKHKTTLLFAIFALALIVINAAAQSQIVVARGQLRPPFTTQTELNRRANDIVKLYGDVGIIVDDIPDNTLTDAALANAKLVILPLNAPLPIANLQALKNAVAKGCRLIAFQPADNDVCALLGIKPLKTPPTGKFEKPVAIVFSPMPGMPEKLEQSPSSVMRLLALPKNGATTIGIYTAEDGSATGLDAVTMNQNGIAFAQTLLIKDRPAITKMLLALTDTAIPGIWETPARKLYETIGVIGGYTTLAELARQVGSFQPGEHSHALAQAIASAENAQTKLAAKEYAAAYLLSEQAQLLARKAYRLVCRPRPNELRGAWIHSAYGISNWGWDKTIRVLSENGFNAIFANMLWGYVADYPSNVLPTHPDVAKKGDQIKLCLEACRKYGVELHVWKVCWNMGHRTPLALRKKMIEAKRTQVTFKGTDTDFLAPHLQENQDMEVAAFLEIIRNYDVDGIHMDYIRYAEEDCDYSPSARAAFEAFLGQQVKDWPADCGVGGKLRRKFNEWRGGNINRLVERVYREAHALKPSISVSAAVFGGWDNAPRSNVAQQAETWIDNGWLDFICPMNYTSDREFFDSLTRRQIDSVKARIPVYIGIGSYLHPDTPATAEQISLARELGGDGFVCFSHNPKFANTVLPDLAQGPTAKFREGPYPHHSPKVSWTPVLSTTPLLAESYAFPEAVTVNASFPEGFQFPQGSSARILCNGAYLPIQPKIGLRRRGSSLACTFIPPRPGVYRMEISDDKTYVSRSMNLEVLSPEDVRQKQIAEGVPQFAKNGLPRVAVWQNQAYGAEDIMKTLVDNGSFDVAPLQNLKPESLAACEAVILPQPRKNAQLFFNPKTAEALHEYVKNGGRLLVTHALAGIRGFNIICPEVTAEVKEPALKTTTWHPVTEHPICKGLPNVSQPSTFVDLIAMTPGSNGHPFALDAASKAPIGIAGTCGKGRYAAWGLGLGIAKGDKDCELTSVEKSLLASIVQWLLATK